MNTINKQWQYNCINDNDQNRTTYIESGTIKLLPFKIFHLKTHYDVLLLARMLKNWLLVELVSCQVTSTKKRRKSKITVSVSTPHSAPKPRKNVKKRRCTQQLSLHSVVSHNYRHIYNPTIKFNNDNR